MFNGIIRYTGKISKIYKKKNNCALEIISKMKFTINDTGSSIACSGACLTLEKYNKNLSKFYLTKETLNKTIFKSSKMGDILNLEKPLQYGERISGHFIQGHIDTTGTIIKIESIDKNFILQILIEKSWLKYCIEKGSIAIDGISLTIADINNNYDKESGLIIVSIIPYTYENTNLKFKNINDSVNVETDFFGKYIEKLLPVNRIS